MLLSWPWANVRGRRRDDFQRRHIYSGTAAAVGDGIGKTGKPVIVLMMCGRPVIFNEVRQQALAILCTWWLGSEAGPAICNVLWGDYNPSGKLPMTFLRIWDSFLCITNIKVRDVLMRTAGGVPSTLTYPPNRPILCVRLILYHF